jgi:murein DD-endopeptidase MepM/ murein hydrolase activator NlpD
LKCSEKAVRGGAILCLTDPGATVSLNGTAIAVADADGLAVIGLSRSADSLANVSVSRPGGPDGALLSVSRQIPVAARSDSVSRFPMECGRISAQTPTQKRHAEISWVKKDRALKTFAPPLAPLGFIRPAEGPYSSPFGVTRTYVPATPDCEGSTSVHNGQDIAVPTGTPIVAPMAGTVILADPDLFYEGGAVFLDLGRGLVSVKMHMSRIDVAAGDVVSQGQVLGLSGATGRVTGPHLHWAIKYRNVHSDDRGTDIWLDPALVLALDADELSH